MMGLVVCSGFKGKRMKKLNGSWILLMRTRLSKNGRRRTGEQAPGFRTVTLRYGIPRREGRNGFDDGRMRMGNRSWILLVSMNLLPRKRSLKPGGKLSGFQTIWRRYKIPPHAETNSPNEDARILSL